MTLSEAAKTFMRSADDFQLWMRPGKLVAFCARLLVTEASTPPTNRADGKPVYQAGLPLRLQPMDIYADDWVQLDGVIVNIPQAAD